MSGRLPPAGRTAPRRRSRSARRFILQQAAEDANRRVPPFLETVPTPAELAQARARAQQQLQADLEASSDED